MKKRNIVLLDLGGVSFLPNGKSSTIINWEIINTLNSKYERGLKYSFTQLLFEYNQLSNQSLHENEFLQEVFSTLDLNTELIDIVKEKNDIIIVSDNYVESINYISEKYDFKKWSIKQIYSYDYKMVKSNPDFFKKLLDEIKEYNFESLIFIDDSTTKIKSASQNGIKGILYQSNEQVKKELQEHFLQLNQ